MIIFSIGSTYFSEVAIRGNLTQLSITTIDNGYYQTTFTREITINESNFVTTVGKYGRTSRNEYNNYDAITIKYIYGIK